MTIINLLPWREERRIQLKKQFFVVLACCAFFGGGVVYLVEMNVQSKISNQVARNMFIQDEQKKLDKKLEEIKTLKKKRSQLQNRLDAINNLQKNRTIIVHHFDELVRALPDGVFLSRVEKKGDRLFISGVAQANHEISGFMRKLENSLWFTNPNLNEVRAGALGNEESNGFMLSVQGVAPKQR